MARWNRLETRGNVEDRRGMGRPAAAVGGLGAVGVVVVLLMTLLGGGGEGLDQIVGQPQESQAAQQPSVQPEEFSGEDDYEVFASTVLGSTDETWGQIFIASDLTYAEPTMVLFRGSTSRPAVARIRRSAPTTALPTGRSISTRPSSTS